MWNRKIKLSWANRKKSQSDTSTHIKDQIKWYRVNNYDTIKITQCKMWYHYFVNLYADLSTLTLHLFHLSEILYLCVYLR